MLGCQGLEGRVKSLEEWSTEMVIGPLQLSILALPRKILTSVQSFLLILFVMIGCGSSLLISSEGEISAQKGASTLEEDITEVTQDSRRSTLLRWHQKPLILSHNLGQLHLEFLMVILQL